MHALMELDCDLLYDSLRTLGFRFRRDPEPFELLRDLLAYVKEEPPQETDAAEKEYEPVML